MSDSKREATAVNEDLLIRMSLAPRVIETITGEAPSIATVYRWTERGLRGQRLRTAYAGGHRRTTTRWLREFFAAVTAAAEGDEASPTAPVASAPSRSREKEIEEAEAFLREQQI